MLEMLEHLVDLWLEDYHHTQPLAVLDNCKGFKMYAEMQKANEAKALAISMEALETKIDYVTCAFETIAD